MGLKERKKENIIDRKNRRNERRESQKKKWLGMKKRDLFKHNHLSLSLLIKQRRHPWFFAIDFFFFFFILFTLIDEEKKKKKKKKKKDLAQSNFFPKKSNKIASLK